MEQNTNLVLLLDKVMQNSIQKVRREANYEKVESGLNTKQALLIVLITLT
ncbi:hypothetical protein [Dyadobacter psychrotolerans]|nr:hypothetical protein [Dyadobacter psychrotolerans]